MESWGVACATTEKHWCPVSTFACFPGEKLPCPISVGRLSLANLQGACAMETNTVALIRTRQIQVIMTLPETLSFSAQLMRCNVSTQWYMLGLGRVGIQPSPPFILWDNSFSCSIQWNLGALLAQPQKNTGVQRLPLPVSAGRLS